MSARPTRVCVVGCGAIGSIFAAHLATLAEVEVWALDVSRPHVDAIAAHGLRVSGSADLTAHVHARTDPGDVPPCDLAIVATKHEHTASAIRSAAGALAGAAVASVQNGLGNEEIIAESVPAVIRGTTLVAGALTGPGSVRFDATGGTWLGPFEPSPAPAEQVGLLADLLTRAGLPAQALPDARGAQWTKLLFNAATNALGAVTGLSIGQLGEDLALRSLVDALIAEGRAVADALGITLDSDPEAMIDDAVRRAYGHRASMLQDVAAERHTEVEVLNGGIVAAGRSAGVPTPLHEALTAIVGGLELSWVRGGPAHG